MNLSPAVYNKNIFSIFRYYNFFFFFDSNYINIIIICKLLLSPTMSASKKLKSWCNKKWNVFRKLWGVHRVKKNTESQDEFGLRDTAAVGSKADGWSVNVIQEFSENLIGVESAGSPVTSEDRDHEKASDTTTRHDQKLAVDLPGDCAAVGTSEAVDVYGKCKVDVYGDCVIYGPSGTRVVDVHGFCVHKQRLALADMEVQRLKKLLYDIKARFIEIDKLVMSVDEKEHSECESKQNFRSFLENLMTVSG